MITRNFHVVYFTLNSGSAPPPVLEPIETGRQGGSRALAGQPGRLFIRHMSAAALERLELQCHIKTIALSKNSMAALLKERSALT
jgi:hypothetical protein